MSDDNLLKKGGLQLYQGYLDEDDDDDGASGRSGGAGGISKPKGGDAFGSSLKTESVAMENERRRLEQAGHRKFAVVNAREKSDEPQQGNTASMGNGVKQHPNPKLQTQRYDGTDPSLNAVPANNPAALAAFEDERAKQEREKQLRLEKSLQNQKDYTNTPTYSSTPRLTR